MTPIHPAALVFPPMNAAEYERFADDIEANGLLDPITLLDGQILDGRHRERACDERGVPKRYVDWDSTCGLTPLEWVISVNLQRRRLTKSQCAALAVEVLPELVEAARERRLEGNRAGGKLAGRGRPIGTGRKRPEPIATPRSREIAAAQFGVGKTLVSRMQAVKERDAGVFEQVKCGNLSAEKAARELGIWTPRVKQQPTRAENRLRVAIEPLRHYLKDWDETRLAGITPAQATRLLRQVNDVSAVLLHVEMALQELSVRSRALN